MKKAGRILSVLLVVLMAMTMLAGCAGGGGANFKVGMVTDAGTIDDKSFNQGTWEGVVKAAKELNIESNYLKPAGTTEADYLKEIGNLYDAGFKLVVAPGYKFETAIFQAQSKYKDAKFVIIDGYPHTGDYNAVVEKNTVSIFFAEEQSGFLVGVAAALQLKEGPVAFIGGMKVPAVQKFNWGFQQGLAYANTNFGTKMTIDKENVIYQGSFDNVAAGQQLGAQMYDKGVKAIFAAAGGVGIGAMNEAKTRAAAGEAVWVIGVDVDQYNEGIYADGKSIILTSAMKRIDQAAYDMVMAVKDGKFPGGQILTLNAKNNGVAIPAENPNLDDDVEKQVAQVFKDIQDGKIVVSAEQGSLIE